MHMHFCEEVLWQGEHLFEGGLGMSSYCNLLSVCLLSFAPVKFSLCCPLGRLGSQIMDSIGCSRGHQSVQT